MQGVPTVPIADTLKGKLSQKKLVRGAANGYSSYGNQIGLATGFVKEIYHPDYVAKRMEIGAVMAHSCVDSFWPVLRDAMSDSNVCIQTILKRL